MISSTDSEGDLLPGSKPQTIPRTKNRKDATRERVIYCTLMGTSLRRVRQGTEM